jgi:Plasmid pRiA4b ORF-3-like protein
VCYEVLYVHSRLPCYLPTPYPARPYQLADLGRLLVTGETTIAELHATIQIAFGWSHSHLHQFIIHGKSYGIAYLGGVSFADDPDQVRLAGFHFRIGQRFYYEYNFHVPWRHEICVEQIVLPAQANATPFVLVRPRRATGRV